MGRADGTSIYERFYGLVDFEGILAFGFAMHPER